MILSFLFYLFLFYLGYKLLFEFIIPLIRTTLQVRSGFKHMHDRMNQNNGNQQPGTSPSGSGSSTPPKKEQGDYIDFEEIK